MVLHVSVTGMLFREGWRKPENVLLEYIQCFVCACLQQNVKHLFARNAEGKNCVFRKVKM